MRNRFLFLTLTSALAACSSSSSATEAALFDGFGSFNGATVEITAEGGFAPMMIRHLVRHDDRAFVFSQRMLCTQVCGAPLDSASGTLSPAVTDSLFNIVLSYANQITRDDYGMTQGGADMRTYVLRVTAGGSVKTVRADDGTMPGPMRQIVQSVSAIISAAR